MKNAPALRPRQRRQLQGVLGRKMRVIIDCQTKNLEMPLGERPSGSGKFYDLPDFFPSNMYTTLPLFQPLTFDYLITNLFLNINVVFH